MRDEEIGMLPRTVELGYRVRRVRFETMPPTPGLFRPFEISQVARDLRPNE